MYDYATVRMQQSILDEITSISTQLNTLYTLLGVIACLIVIRMIISIVRSCL